MEAVLERGIGLVFWFSGYKIVEIISTDWSKKKRLAIFIILILVAVFILYRIECRKQEKIQERHKHKDDLFERCMKYVRRQYDDDEYPAYA